MKEFIDMMDRKSDLQLLAIIEYEYEDYSKEAIEAAKTIMNARTLTEEQLSQIRAEIDESKQLITDRKKKADQLVRKGNKSLSRTLDAINPITSKTDDTVIKLICVFLGYLLVAPIDNLFGMFRFGYIDWWAIEPIVGILIIGFSIYGLLKRKTLGWVLIVVYFSYQFVSAILRLISLNSRYFNQPEPEVMPDIPGGVNISVEPFGSLMEEFSIERLIAKASVVVFVYAIVIWFFSKQNIREMYNVDKPTFIKSLSVGIAIALIIGFFLL